MPIPPRLRRTSGRTAVVVALGVLAVGGGLAAWKFTGKADAGLGGTPTTGAPFGPAPEDAAPPGGGFVEWGERMGIGFRMRFLPTEQGEKFKINLYDHGCGVCVCDVDGDGLDDLYFLNQLGPNALYRNLGDGRFADVTAAAGVALDDRISVGAVFGDVDGDGDPDLYVTSTRGGNAMFRNDGAGRFQDVTAEAGLTLVAHSQSPTLFDYDLDGDLDLFVTNTAGWTFGTMDPKGRFFPGRASLWDLVESPKEKNRLYRNDGAGRFTDVTSAAGVGGHGWGGDATAFDYDEDGDADLFVTNMFGASSLFRNNGDGTFRDVADSVLGATSWGAIGASLLDYDGDGHLDLLVLDMHSDMWPPNTMGPEGVEPRRKYEGPEGPLVERGELSKESALALRDRLRAPKSGVVYGNTLYRNLGGGKFEEVSDRAGAETFWPWSGAAADYDLDGDVDVYVPAGMGFPYFYWPAAFLRNQGDGTFGDDASKVGVDPPPSGPYMEPRAGEPAGIRSSRTAAVGDFDADGRPDIVVGNFNDRSYVYMNRFPKRRWLGLRLRGAKGHSDAIGAVVRIRAGGRTHTRQVQATSSYLAQSSRTLHFGLGDATTIESCEITWPGGAKQKVQGLGIDTVQEVVEARR